MAAVSKMSSHDGIDPTMPRKSTSAQPPPFRPCTFATGEWQNHVNKLISIHCTLHSWRYQQIPDRVHGDRGLEGFNSNGDGFQAYADIGSRTLDERRKGQMDKIRKDLNKLVKYASWWIDTLQGLKLHTWALVVPILDDANLVTYARNKATELREKGLPFIADDFQAEVHTDQQYPRALALIDNPALAYRVIKLRPVVEDDVAALTKQQPKFLPNIERKVKSYLDTKIQDTIDGERDLQLQNHLKASNYLDDMRVHFVSDWEQIEETIATLSDRTRSDNLFSPDSPHKRIRDLQREFTASLTHDVENLPSGRLTLLANGLIARWLGDCTLEFPS